MSINCVLIFCINDQKEFILVKKNRPLSQVGKLNLPGGKIENTDESPSHAAHRELAEETGIHRTHYMTEVGKIKCKDYVIHCFWCISGEVKRDLHPRAEETEIPMWTNINHALRMENLMPNLKVILPLMMSGVSNWEIEDNNDNLNNVGNYKIQLALNVEGDVLDGKKT